MNERIAHQFQRIVESVARLSIGTPLEGTVVSWRESGEQDRLAFTTTAPDGSEPFQSFRGILLCALEGWTDESLDQRLYESSNLSTRALLNRPAQAEQADAAKQETLFFADPGRDLSDCSQCLAYRREIEFQLLRLSTIAREGTSFAGQASQENLQSFVDGLRKFLDLKRELSGTKNAYREHRALHSPTM